MWFPRYANGQIMHTYRHTDTLFAILCTQPAGGMLNLNTSALHVSFYFSYIFCQFAQKLRMNLSSAVYATYSIEAVCYCNFHVLCILLPVITRLLGAYDNKQFVFASDELLLTSWNCYRFNLLRERVLFPPTLPTFPLLFLLLTFIHFFIIFSLCYLCPTTASSPHFAFSPLPTWNTAYC